MEPAFNTSFIPKKSLQSNMGGNGPYVKRRGTYGPGFFVSALLFAVALLVSGGLFFYSGVIERSIDGKINQLEKARDALRPDLISAFEDVDMRLTEAKTLLDNHRAVSALLKHLEDTTLTHVGYASFTYTAPSHESVKASGASESAAGKEALVVNLHGYADSVESMALQIEQYRLSKYVSRVALRSLDRDLEESMETEFLVALTIDPALVTFAETLKLEGAPAVVSSPLSPRDQSTNPVSPASQTDESGTTTISAQNVSTSSGSGDSITP